MIRFLRHGAAYCAHSRLLNTLIASAALLAASSLLLPASNCFAAPINLGQAGNYAVFGLGSTMATGAADTGTLNTAEVFGNVAIGADTGSPTAHGNGSFQKGFIQGN